VLGLEDDLEGARIVGEERHLLKTVLDALEAATRSDVTATGERARDDGRLLQLRDDVSAAKSEDLPSLIEQMHHVGALRAQRGRSVIGSVDRATPYFGHMRLEEMLRPGTRDADGGPRCRDVLVGSRSYVDGGVRIVDWRHAPVSRLYYRYAEGEAYEERLGDRMVEGCVVARRGVSIVGGELVRVSSPQGTFVRGRDGSWRRVASTRVKLETEKAWAARVGTPKDARLGIGADGQMREDKHLPAIAAMLDERQFEMISKEESGLVVIQGSAGSGKTTVGLHRVAFLAFRNPQRFRPDRMLVVVPNKALVHYVAHVLPSLGVEGVRITTFADFSARLVFRTFPRLPARICDETPPIVSRAKSHRAMLRGIDRLVSQTTMELTSRIRAAAERWPSGETAVTAWECTNVGSQAPDQRLVALGQWLGDKRTLAGAPSATTIPAVTRGALDTLAAQLRQRWTHSSVALWDELLTSRSLLDEMFRGEVGFGPGQLDQVHAWCVRQARVRAEGDRDGEEPTLDAEDFALLIRCAQALRGPVLDVDERPVRFAHILVDEVQDATPIELRVLLDLAGPERCVTFAGDPAQRMLDDEDVRGELDWRELMDDLGISHTNFEPLKVSYRSTAEITEFARSVLGSLAHDDFPETTRRGPPVELFGFSATGEAVAWLADVLKQLARDEPSANVALIARFPQQAEVYFEGLARADVPNVRWIAEQDFTWEPGVDVTHLPQIKGLEFDEVVLLETTAASFPATAAARHALYVGATRAAHQLWCVASDVPSTLVTSAIGASSQTPASMVT
jgi:DNA helicase-2/ATP-dependent DNA helicase PcrA